MGAFRFEDELFSLTLADFLCYALSMHHLQNAPILSDCLKVCRQRYPLSAEQFL